MSFSNCTREEFEARKKELQDLRNGKTSEIKHREMPKQILIDITDPQHKLCKFGTLSKHNYNHCSRCGKAVICSNENVAETFKELAHEKYCRTNSICKFYSASNADG